MSSIRLTYGGCGWCGVAIDFYCSKSNTYYELQIEEKDIISLTIKPFSPIYENNILKHNYNVNSIQKFDISRNDFMNNGRFMISLCCYSIAKNNNENIAYIAKCILDFYSNIRVVQENVESEIQNLNLAIFKFESYLKKKLEEDSNDK